MFSFHLMSHNYEKKRSNIWVNKVFDQGMCDPSKDQTAVTFQELEDKNVIE
jgi:hypothetical protein